MSRPRTALLVTRVPPVVDARLRALARVRSSSRARVLATALRLYERTLRSLVG